MSSNIKVQRVCKYCGNAFEARKTTTQTCSDACAKRLYKAKKRGEKIEQSNAETKTQVEMPITNLKAKEFLSVKDVATLIGCSRQTVYTLINSGKLKGVNVKVKKTIIPRAELDKLFSI